MKRALLIITLLTASALVAIGGMSLYLLNSRDGLARLIDWSAALLPGTLTVDHVEGRLRGPLLLRGLTYRDAHREFNLDALQLRWQPKALLTRTLHIEALDLRGLHIALAGDSTSETSTTLHLPFRLVVEQLDAQDLAFASANQPTRRIDRILLNAELEQSTLHIRQFELQAPEGDLQANGTWQTNTAQGIDISTTWRLALPDQPEIRGDGTLEGGLQRLAVTQTLRTPVELTVEMTLENPLRKEPGWTLRTTTERLELRPWNDALATPLQDVAIELNGVGRRFEGNARFAYALPELGVVQLATQLRGGPGELVLSQTQLIPADLALRAQLEARLDLTAMPLVATARGSWSQLQWPLRGSPEFTSSRGQFELKGHPDDFHFILQAPLQKANADLGTWQLNGRGNRNQLRLENINGSLANGTVTGSGSLTWQEGLQWGAELTVEKIDPAIYLPDWPGELAAKISVRGELAQGKPTTRIELQSLSGNLIGYPASANAALTLAPRALQLHTARLRSGTAQVTVDGKIGDEWDLKFELDAQQVGELLPHLAGRVQASGQLRGSLRAPRLDAKLRAAELTTSKARLHDARGEIRADLSPQGALAMRVTLGQLRWEDVVVDQLALSATGRTSAHALEFTARGAGSEMDLRLEGGYSDQRWQGTLTRGHWTHLNTGKWQLAQSVAIEVSSDAATIAPHCWRGSPATEPTTSSSICGEGRWARSGAWQFAGQIEQLPLALLNPVMPGGSTLSAPLDGHFQLQQTDAGIVSGNAQLRLAAGTVHPGNLGIAAGSLRFEGGNLDLQLVDQRLNGNVTLKMLESKGKLNGTVTLQPVVLDAPAPSTTKLGGELDFELTDLELIAALTPQLSVGPGSLSARLTLGGTLAAPELQGSASLQTERVEVAAAGIRLQALEIRANSADGRNWRLSGSTTSGGGKLNVTGTAELDPVRGWPTRLRISGDRFEAVNLRDYWALISPDLTLALNRERVELTGDLRVPEARIRPRRGGVEAVTVSRDAVVIGHEAQSPRSPLPAFHARINLILGDKVEFVGFGLSSHITGQLTIEDTPDSVVKGNGELRVVKGEYQSYGQNLSIESGRLTFAGGPVDNPGIDARAIRRSGDVTAGIVLRGTLRNPQITLFSTPPLPQADILSYLVLGVPVNQANQESGGNSLLATAAALGYVADSPLVRQIRRGLGIEELRIETDSASESVAVVLGRYLSPRLYVSYAVGLGESESSFRIRYKVGKNWTLETESGTQSGADLRYVIEK